MDKDRSILISEIDYINSQIDQHRNTTTQEIETDIKKINENIVKSFNIKYYDGLAESYRILAYIYCYLGDSSAAYENITKAEEIFNKNGTDRKILARIYNTYVIYYGEVQKDYSTTILYCNKGLSLAREIKDNEMIRRFTINLGMMYYQIGLYSDSLKLLQEARKYSLLLKSERGELYSISNIGNCYYKMKNYEKALEYYTKTYEMAQDQGELITFASASKGLAMLAYAEGEKEKSYSYLLKAIEKLRKYSQGGWELNLSLELLKLYIKDKKFEEVERLLPRSERIAQSIKNDEYISSLYKTKSQYYEARDDYKESVKWCQLALDFQEKVYNKRELESVKQIKENRLTKQVEQLEILSKIGRNITSYSTLDEVFGAVNASLGQLYDDFNFAIAIKKGDIVHYDYFYFRGKMLDPFEVHIDNPNSFGNYAIKNDEAVLINDMHNEYMNYINEFQLYGSDSINAVAHSLMAIPLKIENEVIGAIQIQMYKRNSFSVEDLKILEIIGSYTAIAIRNALQTKELQELTVRDSLTGLYNWRFFNQYLNDKAEECTDCPALLSLAIVDIDHFKEVNDQYGHEAGNICLKRISAKVKEVFSSSQVARIGGEEFAIISIDQPEESLVTKSYELIDDIGNMDIHVDDKAIKVTASMGQVIYRTRVPETVDEIFKAADNALYQAKDTGRNKVVIKIVE